MTAFARNILLPIDGSQFMERNINYACDVAKNMGSKLTLMHVVTLPTVLEPGFPIDPKPFEQEGLKILEKAEKIAKDKGIEPETKLRRALGNPAQEILKAAEEGKSDLIIIGAKGHSLLRNLMIGSVCDTVVHNAPCPVLVVR
jgi:nucleotide-binding universal stress UspA family protein